MVSRRSIMIVIKSRWAEGKMERVPELAADLVRLKGDVLVTSASPVIEAANAPPAASRSCSR